MKQVTILFLLFILTGKLNAQWGSVAIFEKGPDQKITSVRVFPVKCTVTTMDDSAYTNLKKSINEYMHLDGVKVYTAFYIPWSGFDVVKKFAIDEYIGKKEAKKVKFIQESEEILLDNAGNVVSSVVKEKPL